MFEKGQDTKIAQITDGTSNTFLVVESTEAVPWTKPDAELEFDPAASPIVLRRRLIAPGRLQRRHGRRLGPVLQEDAST